MARSVERTHRSRSFAVGHEVIAFGRARVYKYSQKLRCVSTVCMCIFIYLYILPVHVGFGTTLLI